MNVVAFVAPLARKSPLDLKAEYINAEFARLARTEARVSKAQESITNAEHTGFYARSNAGRCLIEAKRLLADSDPQTSFEAWCEANIERSMRDVYACMAIAADPDNPERAVWKERAKAAEAMTKSRSASAAKQDNPVYQQNKSVQIAIGLYRKMTPDQRNEVKAAQEEIDYAAQTH